MYEHKSDYPFLLDVSNFIYSKKIIEGKKWIDEVLNWLKENVDGDVRIIGKQEYVYSILQSMFIPHTIKFRYSEDMVRFKLIWM